MLCKHLVVQATLGAVQAPKQQVAILNIQDIRDLCAVLADMKQDSRPPLEKVTADQTK